MAISKVGVVGGGLMGHGIAQICAQAGWDVVLREVDEETLDKGVGKIEKQLAPRGREGQDGAGRRRRRPRRGSTGRSTTAELADCDLVIEAMTEDLEAKLEMWREVDAIVKDDAFFATNTSSLAVIDQAAATSRPDRFLGLHFFNPAQVMPLLEVVQTVTTSEEALQARLRGRREARQDRRPRQGQDRLHRQPAARPLHARRDPRLRGGRRLDRGDRRRDDGRREPPDGPADAGRLRRPRHARRRSAT